MTIQNRIKRSQVHRAQKREKIKQKLERRQAQAKVEKDDPSAKQKRLQENVPQTIDSMREPVPSTSSLPDQPIPIPEQPQVLITTSPKALRPTCNFCEELVGVVPNSQFIRRNKRHGDFSIQNIAAWASRRGYTSLIVVNQGRKLPDGITLIHLPNGPQAYFKLSSVELTQDIFGHARASPHHPELILNNFVTKLGNKVGRMFQTLFPVLPEFEGRQVVTLHNQRDFLFFRRHRYMFRSPEKVALQEIGPRFTLKLQWLKKESQSAAQPEAPVEGDPLADESPASADMAEDVNESVQTDGQFEWRWKKELQTTRRTFFL